MSEGIRRLSTTMAKDSPSFRCSACGATHLRWVGRCTKCQQFGTVEEIAAASNAGTKVRSAAKAPSRPARKVSEIRNAEVKRAPTGLSEFDRVLGGGLVSGQVVLIAGEPGVGKSTLLLSVAQEMAQKGSTVLYVSGEESAEQIGVRARRIGAWADSLLIADETDLQVVLGHIAEQSPDLLIIDSIQTIASRDIDGRAGGVSQVLEVTQAITRAAKSAGLPVLVVGQSTRENSVAGPRALEHLVDTVLTFDGDRQTSLRLLRATKNRYGPADEVACFEQADRGLVQVTDPSEIFRGNRERPVAGTAVTVTIEGRRPMACEVQALSMPAPQPNPRRGVNGLDSSRVAMLLAVTQRDTGIKFSDQDVFVATMGGMRITDTGADLAVCLALATSRSEMALPTNLLALGEVTLSGDIRPVPMLGQRVNEALRLGYRTVVGPPGTMSKMTSMPISAQIIEADHLKSALDKIKFVAATDASTKIAF